MADVTPSTPGTNAPVPAAGAPAPAAPAPQANPQPTGGVEPQAPAAQVPEAPTAQPVDPATWDGWESWDGKDFERFPEQARGWVSELHKRLTAQHGEALGAQERSVAQWKAMYDAVSLGDEDPRIAELTNSVATKDAVYRSALAQVKQLEAQLRQAAEQDTGRYLRWLETNYGERMAANPEAKALGDSLFELVDTKDPERFFEPHVAFELGELGPAAVAQAKAAWDKGWPLEAIVETVKAASVRARQADPVPRARPSAELVAGASETGAARPREAPAPEKRPPNPSNRSDLVNLAQRAIDKMKHLS